ncbi:MAG: hypothetical protein PHV51_02660 [Methanosarcinaceae archaeon]|nr:hypothetical protein [Methanosarcinaceae archaeon]MDD4497045.1 hypothetical protein [Methanosarcinaceae archaeon]
MRPSKVQMELAGFVIFLALYLLGFNMLFRLPEGESPVYAPGTLIFSLLGYWLGGYFHEKIFKTM